MEIIKEYSSWNHPLTGKRTRTSMKYVDFLCARCGVVHTAIKYSVTSGTTKYCKKCAFEVRDEGKTKSKERLYTIYHAMNQRCYNSNSTSYAKYGARGIIICEEWRNSYDIFRDWALSNGYTDNLSIDRIDNDGDYEPSNCRWATNTVQSRNTSKLRTNNKSGYRGVSFRRDRGVFTARIHVHKHITIGQYTTAIEAAKAYDKYILDNNLEHTINGVLDGVT